MSGIRLENDEFISETLVTHKSSGLTELVKTKKKIKWCQFPVNTGKKY